MHDAEMQLRTATTAVTAAATEATVSLPESMMLELYANVLCPQSIPGSKISAILEVSDVPASRDGDVPWQALRTQVISPVTMAMPDQIFKYDSLLAGVPNGDGVYASGTGAANYSDTTTATIAGGSFWHFAANDADGVDQTSNFAKLAVNDVIALYWGPDEWASATVAAAPADNADTASVRSIDVTHIAHEVATNSVVAVVGTRVQPVFLFHWKGARRDEIRVPIPIDTIAPFVRLRFANADGSPNFGAVSVPISCEGPMTLGTRHNPSPNGQRFGPPDWYNYGGHR